MQRLILHLRKIFFSKYVLCASLFIIVAYYFIPYPLHLTNQSVLRIGTDGIYPPHSFHTKNGGGELTGFDIDLIKEIAHRLNLKVKFFETAVSGLIAGIDTNRYDVLVNVSVTPLREKKYSFSTPYITHNLLLIVRSDEQNIHSFKDLSDKKVVQILGTDLSRFTKELASHLIFSHNFEQSLQLLLSKRADATMIPDIPFLNFLERRPNEAHFFKIADRIKNNNAIAFMLRKDNDELKKSINETLCAIHLDGTYKKIFNKYFDDNMKPSIPICPS
ncbi:transporter substrate-binding domain-containing protein [Candidatus Liberibacter africanus]|uniref:Putative amino acid-binding periplasmic ABC transporter protein n=1 Tax=Candidatus Liberibacter africanus PTSAPSY TaxID=1277257 RepID=A0A0G3I428_LIBAF|nr:transporter substrate-binding domain-containing protein [Candidatus Liberibacter africanus]AKK20651.1 putative amino acid-binding periplasmic ABC transporter protein [Candidatus Liberibacter africanus PTSAPSY]QTP64326.1 transporter substrate-binding domain-containing protein [Candidatus Liberibacter africanus]